MTDEVLFMVDKHGLISKKYPYNRVSGGFIEHGVLESVIWLTPDGIGISDKEFDYPIKILFDEIIEFKEIEGRESQAGGKMIRINYANDKRMYIIFSNRSRWQEKIHNEFYQNLQVLMEQHQEKRINEFKDNILEYIAPYNQITFKEIAKYFKISPEYVENEIIKMIENKNLVAKLNSDTVILREPLKDAFKANFFDYIRPYDEVSFASLSEHFELDKEYIENEIKKLLENGQLEARLCSDRIILREPTPKLTIMKCPNCNAPLDSKPPCTCDHCGVLIEISK